MCLTEGDLGLLFISSFYYYLVVGPVGFEFLKFSIFCWA